MQVYQLATTGSSLTLTVMVYSPEKESAGYKYNAVQYDTKAKSNILHTTCLVTAQYTHTIYTQLTTAMLK